MDVILYLVFLIVIFYLSSILFSSSNKSKSDDKTETHIPEKPAEELKKELPTQIQQKTQPKLSEAEIEKIVNEAKESQESRNNPQVEQTPNSYGNVEPRFKVVPKPTARTEKTGEVTQVKQTPSSSSTVKKTSSSPYMTEYEKRKKEIDEGIKNGTYHVTQVQGNARTNKTSGQSKKPSYLQPTVKQPKQSNKPRTAEINPDKLDGYTLYQQKFLLTQYYKRHPFQSNNSGEISCGEILCPHDGHILFRADTFYKSEFYKKVLCCQKCHTIYPYEKVKYVDFTEGKHILYVCKKHTVGTKNNHKTLSVTGFLGLRGGNKIQINVSYCYNCKRFFIFYEAYEEYRRKYGRDIMGDIIFLEDSLTHSNPPVKVESILHEYGYTVNVNSKLTPYDRRRILEWLIDQQIITKTDVIAYLSIFIDRGKKIPSWHDALLKWQADLAYIQEYKSDTQQTVEICAIKKGLH